MKLLSFMAFICLAVKPQANTSDLASNALLKKLLELHQYYCGEAATCGSSEHVEPSEFLLPVPCCIPCSCLPSCVEQQNCCPVSVNGTLTEPMTTSRLNTIVQENEKIKSNNGLVSDTNDMTLFDWNKTGENKAEIETDEIRIENSTTFTSMDSEILEMIETERANEKCTRPQVLYKPNRYLDSEAYMMVRDCPDGFEDRLIIDKCNAGIDEVGLLDMIPVTSKLSGVAYKNKHCLMCNEKQQAEHMIEWRVEFVSSGARREHIFFPNPDAVVDTLIEKRKMFNNIHFVPNNESMSRPCKLYDITTCNQTGLWDVYDEFIETVCLNGYQLPIISKINNQMFTFNNIGCLHCNTGMDLREERLSCSYWENRSKSYFSVTLNLRSIVPNDQIRPLLELAPYIEHDSLQQLPHRRCPAGKLDLLGRCRGIFCPRDHYILENQCVPLYDAVKGLDLSVRIHITPSRAIPRSISGVFVDNLKQMADAALDDAVRLARRPVSLWYLPRSNANPTEYYMLDVFLFSQSNVIKYYVAIAQIKQFFLKMKTGVKLTILEALNIKLNFQFQHGVDPKIVRYTDVSNGMVLKPLMENGWSLTIPGPYMAISEINWCFRTVFDRSELDYFRHHIVVKSTGTMVFYDQFDRQHDTIYLCIDLFVEQMRHEEHSHSIKDETAPIDYDSGKYGEITVDSDRGFILTVSMIAIIVLLVILYRVKKTVKRKQIEESNRANRQPPDFVELSVISNLNIDDHM